MNPPTLDILLIDGHSDQAQWALDAFKAMAEAPKARHFPTGQDSLFFLRQAAPHQGAPKPRLILFDWELPHGNGAEVLAEIKSDDTLKGIPMVIWTASAKPDQILEAYKHFANSYVIKPMEPRDYAQTLARIVSFWLSTAQLPEP